MLIIGDACTDHTSKKVAEFRDERIHFVNLPERFGEQAGPNSVGMMLAETEFIAFLNHDDLWLPNHLDLAIHKLEEEKADIYWSRAAFFKNRGPRGDLPIFVESSPTNRTLAKVYDKPFYYAEPISTWAMYTASSRKLGLMSLSSKTPLRPLKDYTIRAWQLGFTLSIGEDITVLKDNMGQVILPNETKLNSYDLDNDYTEKLVQLIEEGATSVLQERISVDLWLAEHLGLARSFELDNPQEQESPSNIFLKTGLDLLRLKASAESRGFMGFLGKALEKRTGEILTTQPDINNMIRFARKQLENDRESSINLA